MNKRVLIVDDDEDMQAILQTILEESDYDVATAGDGLAALDELEKATPDLILLDLMMPRMDGYAFAEALRSRKLQPSIPVIVLSADINAQQRVQQIGANSYLTKPFDMYDLLGEISYLIEQRVPEEASQN